MGFRTETIYDAWPQSALHPHWRIEYARSFTTVASPPQPAQCIVIRERRACRYGYNKKNGPSVTDRPFDHQKSSRGSSTFYQFSGSAPPSISRRSRLIYRQRYTGYQASSTCALRRWKWPIRWRRIFRQGNRLARCRAVN